MPSFLDRAPYIWLWRPTYRVFGSWIRECKALITRDDRIEAEMRFAKAEMRFAKAEMRFAKIEATQRETSEVLEQLLVTMLGDRQIPRAMEEMQALMASELSKQVETSAANAVQDKID